LNGEKTNILKTISVLALRVLLVGGWMDGWMGCPSYLYQQPEDKDRDGLQNTGFLTIQPLDLADSLRELHYTQSLGKHQICIHVF